MAVIEKLSVTYGKDESAKTDEVFARRLKFRKRARMFAELRARTPEPTQFEIDKAVKEDKQPQGTPPLDAVADFTIEMIQQSICDRDGKLTLSADDIDDWDDDKRNAYLTAVRSFQMPQLEQIAKNSSPTGTNAT